jgi:NAD(P)H-flavin reductase
LFLIQKINTLIKVYRPQPPTYLGGRLGNHLEKLKIGDTINIEGPFGKFVYEAPGRISVCQEYTSKTKKVADVKRIFFIAAGTGMTPIYQTLLEIVNNPNDKT